MSEKKIHTEFLNDKELPAVIPSADDAWNDMRKKLDKDKTNKKPFFFWLLLSFVLFCMLAGFVFFSGINSNKKNDVIVTENRNDDAIANNIQKLPGDENTDDTIKNEDSNTANQNQKVQGDENKMQPSTTHKKHHAVVVKTNENYLAKQLTKNTVQSNDVVINDYAFINRTKADQQEQLIVTDSIGRKFQPDSSTDAMKSAAHSAAKIKITQKPKTTILAGLQWNTQIPFAGVDGYFTGPNAKAQPYRILLPGVWISIMEGKSIFTLEANIFHTASVPQKLFFTGVSSKVNEDTAIITTETKTLTRLFGFSTAVGYNHNIKNNWWLGGNLQFASWNKGLVHSAGVIEKKSLSGSFETITRTFSKHHPITTTEKTSFSKSQFMVNAELWYRKNIWQAGLRTGISVTPLANQKGPSNSFRTDIMFRVALWNSLNEK